MITIIAFVLKIFHFFNYNIEKIIIYEMISRLIICMNHDKKIIIKKYLNIDENV